MSKLTPVSAIALAPINEPALGPIGEINPFRYQRRNPMAERLRQEDLRCAAIEGRREKELLWEAENEARHRRIERLRADIAAIRLDPANETEHAYRVHLGITDAEAEIRMEEQGA